MENSKDLIFFFQGSRKGQVRELLCSLDWNDFKTLCCRLQEENLLKNILLENKK